MTRGILNRRAIVLIAGIFSAASLFVFSSPIFLESAYAGPNGCPMERKKLNPPSDCDSKPNQAEKDECTKCKDVIETQERAMNAYDARKVACEMRAAECAADIAKFRSCGKQASCQGDAGTSSRAGQQCSNANQLENERAAKAAGTCKEKISNSCKGKMRAVGDKEAKSCADAEKDTKKTAKENGDKAKQQGDNAKKNEDNKKKEESAGGMPQIPPIPPMPEKKGEEPKEAEATTATQPQVAVDPDPTMPAASKLDDGRVGNGVAFSTDTSTNTQTSTIAAPGGFSGSPTLPHEDKTFGDTSQAGNGAGNGLGSYSSGGGSGAAAGMQSSASAPAAAEHPKTEAATEPYDLTPGGGGKLGAPKGLKSGGESDSALDAAAKDTFTKDLEVDGERAPAGEGVASDEDDGFTIFKMVKFRYAELKKLGNI